MPHFAMVKNRREFSAVFSQHLLDVYKRQALERAKRRMQHQKSHRDFVRAKASIARALARMRVFDDTHKS